MGGWGESHSPQTPHLLPRPEGESPELPPENQDQPWVWETAWKQPFGQAGDLASPDRVPGATALNKLGHVYLGL